MNFRSTVVFLLTASITYTQEATAGFCERVIKQLSGYDVYGGYDDAKDREKLGDAAFEAGISYVAIKVPISQLPDLLESPYLPRKNGGNGMESHVLEAVGTSKIGVDVAGRLGGWNIRLTPREPDLGPEQNGTTPIQANPNHNALILYSPRIFSLTPWTYGNLLHISKPQNFNDPGQLCAGWSCVSSNSSDTSRTQAFRQMASSNDERWMVRADGLLPRYEIVGILVQPDNEHFVKAVLNDGLKSWENKLVFQTTYPQIDVRHINLSQDLLYELAADISPEVVHRTSVVTTFSDDLPEKIRGLVKLHVMTNKILREKDKHHNSWSGYSAYEVQMMTELEDVLSRGGETDGNTMPKLLPGAKLSRVGKIEFHGVRRWEFILAEYKSQSDEARLVLFIRNDGKKSPPKDVPYQVWGVGQYVDDSIEWVWTPDGEENR